MSYTASINPEADWSEYDEEDTIWDLVEKGLYNIDEPQDETIYKAPIPHEVLQRKERKKAKEAARIARKEARAWDYPKGLPAVYFGDVPFPDMEISSVRCLDDATDQELIVFDEIDEHAFQPRKKDR